MSIYRVRECNTNTTPISQAEVEGHVLLQIHIALFEGDGVSSTLFLNLIPPYFLDRKSATYLHQLLEAHPDIDTFYVRSDGKELVVKPRNDGKKEIVVILPHGAGKFVTAAAPPLEEGQIKKAFKCIFPKVNFPVGKKKSSTGTKNRDSVGALAPYDERRVDAQPSTAHLETSSRHRNKMPRVVGILPGAVMLELKRKTLPRAVMMDADLNMVPPTAAGSNLSSGTLPAPPESNRSSGTAYTWETVPGEDGGEDKSN